MAIIRPEVSEITGLDNYNLSGQSMFERKTGELLNSFLAHLTPPLCLVAHNGDKYDFPLLKAELEKAGITLPFHTLCADSYLGIKEIVSRKEEVIHSLIDDQMDLGSTENTETANLTELIDTEYGDIEKENSRTPTKTDTLGNTETTPNTRFTRLNILKKKKRNADHCEIEIKEEA